MEELVKTIQSHEEWLVHKLKAYINQMDSNQNLDLNWKSFITSLSTVLSQSLKTFNPAQTTNPYITQKNNIHIELEKVFLPIINNSTPLFVAAGIVKFSRSCFIDLIKEKHLENENYNKFINHYFDIFEINLLKLWENNSSKEIKNNYQKEIVTLKESNLRILVNAISEMFIMIDIDGTILTTNEKTVKILGHRNENIEGMNLYSLLPLDVSQTRKSMITLVIKNNQTLKFEDKSMGRYYLNSIYPISENNTVNRVAIFINDLTERKEAEKALRDSKTILGIILDSIHIRIFWKDTNSKYLGCNDFFANDAGENSKANVIGKTDYDLVWKDKAEQFILDDQKVIKSGISKLNFEESRYADDGKIHWFKTSKIPLKDSLDNIIGVVGIYEDITSHKYTLNQLKINEKRYRVLFENSPTPLWEEDFSKVKLIIEKLKKRGVKHFEKYFTDHPEILNECIKEIRVTNINKATMEYINVKSKDDIIDNIEIQMKNEMSDIFKQELLAFCNNKIYFKSDLCQQQIHGKTKWVLITATIVTGFEDNWSKVIVSVMDLTEQKQNQEALLESEQKYKVLFENANDAIFVLKNNIIIDCNTKTQHRFYLDKKVIIGKMPHKELSPKYQPDGQLSKDKGEKILRRVLQGETLIFEWLHKRKDGTEFLTEVSLNQMKTKDDILILAAFRDITDRKKAEIKLLYSEKKYRNLFETMAQGVVYQNKSGAITAVNPAAELILGYTENELMGKTSHNKEWKSIKEDGSPFPGNEHPAAIAQKTGIPVKNIIMGVFNHLENEYKWILINSTPIFKDGDPNPVQTSTTFDDITDQIVNAKKMQKYAETQNVLLQEVNHRVKNNLSAIISMLHKEMDRAEQRGFTNYLPLLKNLDIRVNGLLTVHSMLSKSKWQPIQLKELCEKIIANTLKGVSPQQKIDFFTSQTTVKINSRIAQNLSIVLNELTTNSIKYALDNRTKATIKINVKNYKNKFILIFRDDGLGFPAKILKGKINNTQIGFGLIYGIIVHTLGGKIKTFNDKGAVVELSIPNPDSELL